MNEKSLKGWLSNENITRRIVMLNGGLGNQAFQYIFMRWLEIKTNSSCVIDDSAFYGENIDFNGWELERIFGVRPAKLSEFVSPGKWQDMLWEKERGRGIAQQLLDDGNQIAMVASTNDFAFSGNIYYTGTYEPNVLLAKGLWYFHGYWIDKAYFYEIKDIILNEFSFPVLTDSRNMQYRDDILNSNSIGIHIRRGDFIKWNIEAPMDFYQKAIAYIDERESQPTYFVFSDDLPWCQENLAAIGLDGKRVVFVDGNSGLTAYIDMQLMSYCKHLIIDRSSFAYLAALLNQRREIVISSTPSFKV
ncbi:alpha-1,2-fucosyltransferase [Selenomonas ruminis]|uniref:Alpha-1,2-fucosyltransferase n=1 Tax=Selenomonas ruminis TaxID=2593411 RepID=A0A5D6WC29_9FIRM|nr:alpha-1,2-fucosyltransferase [Selenomonas sp. mPRGC5]TYZ24154.1 alpha-1,2-fucosyltransferase [Selenomonas sp. mPRGC5]